ncbi:MAG: ATP-binding protein [Cyclobacteriaceae bacterium]
MDNLMHIDIKEILDFIPDAALFINEEAEEVKINTIAGSFIGYEAFVPLDISCIFSIDSINEIKEIPSHLSFGKLDVILNTAEGLLIPAILKYKKVPEGWIATLQSFIFDFEENFDIISEAVSDSIVVFLENDELIYISSSLEKTLGYSRQEFFKSDINSIIHPEDTNRILTRKQIAKQQRAKRFNQIFRARHKNGQFIWLEAKVSRKYYQNDQKHKSIVLIKDITKRIQYEQALIEAKQTAEEAVKSKNQFLSEVSHDIRTPMNTIIGISHLLLNKKPRKDQVDLINTIKVSGNNLLSLINDILDFSKIQANKIEFESVDFDLILLLKSLKIGFQIPAEAKGLEFSLITDSKLPQHVKGDPYRLNQILNNLLSNAIKFTNSGNVALRVNSRETNNGYQVTFEVSDTGIGIASDKIEFIFKPYTQASKDTTRKYGGTGLGLTILKKLVELQGGTITVESKLQQGSKFIISLPFAKAEEKTQHEFLETADLSEVRLLYVEDVISNQLLMKGLCALWGVKIDVAATGKRAFALLQENTYDLLLIDLQLPDINGIELVKNIRAFGSEYYQNIPVIAVTGETTNGLVKKLQAAGFNDLASKPFNPQKLFEKIHSLLDKQHEGNFIIEKFSEANFGTLDQLYQNKSEDYFNLLNLLKIEYQKYFEALQYSIENHDLKGVRSIIHKMTPNLKTLGMPDVIAFLQKIKNEMRNNPASFNEQQIVHQLQPIFQNLINLLEQKIFSLEQNDDK